MRLLGRHDDLPTADPYLPHHGDPAWSAEHYDLDLTYGVGDNRLRGQATIRARLVTATDRLVLDLAHLDVSKVTVDGKAPEKYAVRGHRVVVTLRRQAQPGSTLTLVLKYGGRPKPLVERHVGEAGWEELTDGVIVAGQPHGAPTWFPCNDRPDDKASYAITVTTDPGYVVVANGRQRSHRRRGSAETWVFDQAEPMATYLATVQIGRYDVRRLGRRPVPVTGLVPADIGPGFLAAFGRQAEMLAFFADRFGPYPFPAYAVVVTADDLEIPLESQTLATFGRNLCRGDWDAVRLVAHELAHQWFGNAVTLRAWRDIWLHEGFACYSEWLWSEESGGVAADVWARRHHRRLSGLAQDLVLADPGAGQMFDDRVYKRGALTLHALRLTVGDDAFFDLLRAWVAEHRGGSVTTDDFVAMAAARTGVDAGTVLTPWLREGPLPDLPPAT